MIYSRETPATSGFYWVKGAGERTIVEYDHSQRAVLDVDIWVPLERFAEDWDHWSSDPIPEPD